MSSSFFYPRPKGIIINNYFDPASEGVEEYLSLNFIFILVWFHYALKLILDIDINDSDLNICKYCTLKTLSKNLSDVISALFLNGQIEWEIRYHIVT